jgi:hypothetical protein
MKIDDVSILYSPLTSKIYVGIPRKDGTCSNKKDVTDHVISTMFQHFHDTKDAYQNDDMGIMTLLSEKEYQMIKDMRSASGA